MSQNTLIEKIKQDAANAVAEINSTGAADVLAIEHETATEVASLQKAHKVSVAKKQAQAELVAVSRAKQAGKIAVQQAKRNQIDAIFTAVISELEGQSTDEYVAFFQKYTAEFLPKAVEVKVVNTPEARVAETKQIMTNLNLTGEVKADNTIKAGLVVEATDGVYDVTLGRLMNEKRAELEVKVVNQVKA